jgi:hypothetical protein
MSTGQSSAPSPAKPRSPIERAIVWGGILVLVVLVAIEFNWKRSHETALSSLLEKIKQDEMANTSLKAADVKAIVGERVPRVENLSGRRLVSNAARVEIYSWPTLNMLRKRELYVYYGIGEGDDADVIGVTDAEDVETAELFSMPPAKPTPPANDPAGNNPAGNSET